jgi:hypothetical protein
MIPNNIAVKDFLVRLLATRASAEGLRWLNSRKAAMESADTDRVFHLSFSAVPRYLGKAPLRPSAEALSEAEDLRVGFNPSAWRVDQAARIWLLLYLPHDGADDLVGKVESLFSTADMGELTALYAALPLLPFADRWRERAAEGVRSNMTNVFDAIALDNPYPAEQFDEGAWNQMALKAAFMDRPLYRIYGLEARANPTLSRVISDYAHERWAAGRVVSPELWRAAGSFVDEVLLPDLRRLLLSSEPLEQQAATLACLASDHAGARELLEEYPTWVDEARGGRLDWRSLSLAWWERKDKPTT